MEVVIRKPGKDLVKFLLDKALEEGMPVNVVRLIPDGLYIPIELADAAGLLDPFKPAQEEKNDGRDAEPVKRATRKRASKSTASTSEGEEDSQAQSTDPWD